MTSFVLESADIPKRDERKDSGWKIVAPGTFTVQKVTSIDALKALMGSSKFRPGILT
jgi:hypothetical protein